MDNSSPNANSGTVNEITYFAAEFGHGYFVPPEEICDQDEKIQDSMNMMAEYPKIGEIVELFNRTTGIVQLSSIW